ncbi:uncharacterized protein LOC122855015 isoform X2 [Aphidius gifuensis]|uniref:uncharacterized protein LOC122855015 isoform X2 n=1 Tax=Aphidius gifuensis TaxID=684658 RepID=UPI001CDC9600|nr:uncharacterized protein LOC122855015 isoform X2 [Aphidius gifuensis]
MKFKCIICFIKFYHSKAEKMSTTHSKIPVTIDSQLKLKDIECKLYFVLSSDKVCMGVLDVEILFYYKELQCQDDSNLSCNSCDVIGGVWMAMKLVDLGPYRKTDLQTWEDNFRASILDDRLTYKIIDELEAWKERHQEIFYIELKKKEKRYLNRLSEEWKEPKEVLDTLHSLSVFQGHTEVVTLINKINKNWFDELWGYFY